MTQPFRRRIAVVGGGPAGLMAAEVLAREGNAVTIFDRMPTLGRKLLMAGRGGLNLTHSEPLEDILARYEGARPHLEAPIRAFPPAALVSWSEALGQETFIGSSGRIFPRVLKASPLLRAWLQRLDGLGVGIRVRHRWLGWSARGALRFETASREVVEHSADAAILALGGASWPRLGSDGNWQAILHGIGIPLTPLAPTNCGFAIAWSDHVRLRFSGLPLKRIALEFAGRRVRGEAVVTSAGVEGGAIYALSAPLRNAIARDGGALVSLDLRPDLDVADLIRLLSDARGKQSLSTFLAKKAKLPPVMVALLREGHRGALPNDPQALARRIKQVPLRLTAPLPLERAISTAGGVRFDGVDDNLMLRAKPGVFVAGEMLDWEAPTGGYLLQACLATGRGAALGALAWLARSERYA